VKKSPIADGRTQIEFDEGNIGQHTDQITALLAKADLPIYQIGGRLVEPVRLDQEETEDGVRRPAGALILNRIERYRLGDLMSKVVYLFKVTKNAIQGVSPCSAHIADHYLKRAGHWPHPVINGIVEAPTFRADGTVASTEGYDTASGLYLDFRGVEFPRIPEQPSRDDAVAALAVLKVPLEEFPFVDVAARSVALTAILTAFCRRTLTAAPLHAFDAPVRGTGKTLLANLAA
jgi:putative DNA primase/helicase